MPKLLTACLGCRAWHRGRAGFPVWIKGTGNSSSWKFLASETRVGTGQVLGRYYRRDLS